MPRSGSHSATSFDEITTNSGERMLRACSAYILSVPRATHGGWDPSTLKKLKGAAFTTPAESMVVTQAIGRG
jgi:hypothetical protein